MAIAALLSIHISISSLGEDVYYVVQSMNQFPSRSTVHKPSSTLRQQAADHCSH